MPPREINCKLVLLGKESTGKSSLCKRFIQDEFERGHPVTVGASYAAKKIATSKGRVVVSVWDTAGEEKFDSLTRLYYTGASAALVCIDPTDGSSFSKSQYWVKELKQNQPDCRCYIVLTKCDLLEQPQPSADPGVSERGEAAPQEAESKQSKPREGGGAELEGVRGEEGSRRGGSGRSPPPGEGLVSVKSRQPGLSPTSPFEREYSGDALDASESGEGIAVHNSPNGTPRIQSVTSMAPLIISLFFLCFL